MPRIAIVAAVGHVVAMRRSERGRVARHLQRDVEALDHAELRAGRRPGRARADRPTTVAPIRAASARRTGLGSLTTTNRAPAWRDDGGRHEADRPGAGDQHVLAQHRERERRVDRVAERVEDRGDVLVDARPVAARRWSSAGPRTRRTRRRGRRRGRRVGAQVAAAGQAVAAQPAGDVALAADDVAGREVVRRSSPTSTTSPTNSWPTTSGGLIVLRRPGVPRLDVEVGAADPGLADPDQHVVDADLRVGDGLEREARGPARSSRERASVPLLGSCAGAALRRVRRRGRGSSVQSTIGFSTTPMPSISHRTRSPGSRNTGGSRNTPTPAGVPVAMRSPGSRVMWREMKLTSGRHVEHEVGRRCRPASAPACRRRRRCPGMCHERMRQAGGGIDLVAASRTSGPIGRKVSLPLARSHWPSPFSPSRSAGGVALPVAGADVVDDDVARDVVHRVASRHAARRACR